MTSTASDSALAATSSAFCAPEEYFTGSVAVPIETMLESVARLRRQRTDGPRVLFIEVVKDVPANTAGTARAAPPRPTVHALLDRFLVLPTQVAAEELYRCHGTVQNLHIIIAAIIRQAAAASDQSLYSRAVTLLVNGWPGLMPALEQHITDAMADGNDAAVQAGALLCKPAVKRFWDTVEPQAADIDFLLRNVSHFRACRGDAQTLDKIGHLQLSRAQRLRNENAKGLFSGPNV
jgi:hypothetical protein